MKYKLEKLNGMMFFSPGNRYLKISRTTQPLEKQIKQTGLNAVKLPSPQLSFNLLWPYKEP